MAIEVPIPDDVRRHDTKAFLIFTKRQFRYILTGICWGFLWALLIPGTTLTKSAIGCLLAFPVILIGFIKLDGAYLDVLLIRIIYLYFLTPIKRKIKAIPSLYEQYRKEKEMEQEIKFRNYRKKHASSFRKVKRVLYNNKPEYKIHS